MFIYLFFMIDFQNNFQKKFIVHSNSSTSNSVATNVKSGKLIYKTYFTFIYSIKSIILICNLVSAKEPIICGTINHIKEKYIDEEIIQTQSDLKSLQIEENSLELKIKKCKYN